MQKQNLKQDPSKVKHLGRLEYIDDNYSEQLFANNNDETEYEVILLIDNREKMNMGSGNYLFDKVKLSGIKCSEVSLPLGDFLWVLRVKEA